MEEIPIKRIEKNIYLNILEISDIKSQKKLWFGGDTTSVSSYTEVMCQLFDDNNFESFLKEDVDKLEYSHSFVNKLKTLKDQLSNYNVEDDKTDIEIVNDPQWQKISQYAKSIIKIWPGEINIS